MGLPKAPNGWPLKRPLVEKKLDHVVRALIARRIPGRIAIEQTDLVRNVCADMCLAEPRLWLDRGAYRLHRFQDRDHTLAYVDYLGNSVGLYDPVPVRPNPERPGYMVLGAQANERTRIFLRLLPRVIRAVVNYLLVSNAQEWMAYCVAEAEAGNDAPIS